MVKKTYRTFYLKGLAFNFVDKDGRFVEVNFHRGAHPDSTSKFTTTNEEVQQMLENSKGFNRDFFIEDEVEINQAGEAETPVFKKEKIEEAQPEKQVLDNVKDIKRFHNIVEMRNYMAELGFEGVQSMNYMQAKAAAAKEGYDFQIQKK